MAKPTRDVLSFIGERLNPISKDILFAMTRTRDDWFWRQLYSDKRRSWLAKAQKLDPDAHLEYGHDLAAAKFVIQRCGGKVRDERGVWVSESRDLPPAYIKSFKATAIDLSSRNIIMEGTDNFAGLEHLESLDLSRNKFLDDFACDNLARQFRASKALSVIDLSYNEQITIYGLHSLFRIPSIRHIRAVGTPASQHPDKELFLIAAEDERGCQVTFDCLSLDCK